MVEVASESKPKKRLFLGLAALSLLVAATAAFALWAVSSPGLAHIHGALPVVAAVVLACAVAALGLGIVGMVLATLGVPPPLEVARTFAWYAINLVFRPAVMLGRFIQFDKERIERSFIELSNQIVRRRQVAVRPDQVLLLLPHCLQLDACRHKITSRIDNCKDCGQCTISAIRALAHSRGIHVAVVPGGTLARKVIQSLRPRAVLAVACERDLVSGIQDVFPLPVIGVLNQRPHGPCCNTIVDVARIEDAVDALLARSATGANRPDPRR
ncbi:MAG: DUF116 domain-containing protein [Polyangiaceae bacterium]|jgi:hypothetical protein|nr:DUF116 domain-containing protein [Polyangiaceae bacterium]